MQVYRDLSQLPNLPRPVVTIGTFDGVHLGHRALISRVGDLAKACGGTSVLVTFFPHPRSIIQPDAELRMLQTLDEKLEALADEGLDALVVVPFTREFSDIPAEAYVRDFLLRDLRPHTVVIGYDHRYGRDRSGDITLLRSMAEASGVRVIEIDEQDIDAIAVSSTRIRKALLAGRVEEAEQLLGRPYSLSGIVIRGDQIGRQLGYPTANLHVADATKLVPADGIYAIRVTRGDTVYGGMLSIGMRPTFNGTERRIEANLFDFSGDLYGETLQVSCLAWLRGEVRFEDRAALVAAMDQDRLQSLAILASRPG